MRKYSEGFKEALLKKVFASGAGSIASIAQEEGVHPHTLYKWVKKVKEGSLSSKKTKATTTKFSSEEKLQLVFQASQLEGEALGRFLRQQGLYSHQIDLWKKEMLNALSDKPSTKKKDPKDLKIKKLEKEIRLKDKTLAEASILLLVKKNMEQRWKEEEEKLP